MPSGFHRTALQLACAVLMVATGCGAAMCVGVWLGWLFDFYVSWRVAGDPRPFTRSLAYLELMYISFAVVLASMMVMVAFAWIQSRWGAD